MPTPTMTTGQAGQLQLPLELRVPDVREDCDSHLASLLRDIYFFHEKDLKTSKNKDWAARYGLSERTIPALLERLKDLDLVEIDIRHGRDRFITPKFAIDDVALRWRRFAGYAWRMLSTTVRNILKARRIRSATEAPRSMSAAPIEKPVEKREESAPATSLAPEIAPSNHPKSHPYPYEGTERKRKNIQQREAGKTDEAPRLSHAESAAVDSLIARGVEPPAARLLVERFGSGACATVARLLGWREKMGRTYDSSVTAWTRWFTREWSENRIQLPAGFTNQVSPKAPSDLGERPQRVVADPEAAAKLQAEREAKQAEETRQKAAEAAFEALGDVERGRRLQEALTEVLRQHSAGVARTKIQRAGIEHRLVVSLAVGKLRDELKAETTS